MKEKLRCNEKVIVDKNSRPTGEDMKNLSATFTVTEVKVNKRRNKEYYAK